MTTTTKTTTSWEQHACANCGHAEMLRPGVPLPWTCGECSSNRAGFDAGYAAAVEKLTTRARGCFDYLGGYHGAELEVFHHGVQTVVNVLVAEESTQTRVLERLGRQDDTPDRAELERILRRAGVPADKVDLALEYILDDSLDGTTKVAPDLLRRVASSLLRDAVREGRRWSARVKLVESRTEFAVSALRGGHDDDLC